jgi:hypothetical protein
MMFTLKTMLYFSATILFCTSVAIAAKRHAPSVWAVGLTELEMQVLLDRAGFSPGEIDDNYNSELFCDADPAKAEEKIAAGPNNPVGVVWIEINKAHYGIHGTPEPGRSAIPSLTGACAWQIGTPAGSPGW